MTYCIAVLEDGYSASEVVVNVMAPRVEVAALLANVGRPRMMTTNSILAIVCTFVTVNMSVINIAKLFEGAYNRD